MASGHRFSIVIERDDEHGYFAYAPALPGCHTQGDTLDEAVANIREAVEGYVATLEPDVRRDLASRDVLTSSVEVAVA